MKKIIIVVGPTASGKTDLAIKLAKEQNGELINADSRQIYKYLDIGTNKGDIEFKNDYEIQIDGAEINLPLNTIEDIPIHLVSFLEPDKKFDVYTFRQYAFALIEDVINRGKQPIIVGGTGLYIDALIKDYNLTTIEANEELRSEFETKSLEDVQNELIKLSKETFENLNDSDKKNKRRIIRFIEKLSTENINEPDQIDNSQEKYEFELLMPKFEWEELKVKIENRVEQMFSDGIIKEVKDVLEKGYPEDSNALQGIGYREILSFLNGEISINECIEEVKIAHRQYAKRQRTWFEGEGRGYQIKIIE